ARARRPARPAAAVPARPVPPGDVAPGRPVRRGAGGLLLLLLCGAARPRLPSPRAPREAEPLARPASPARRARGPLRWRQARRVALVPAARRRRLHRALRAGE